MIDYEIIASGSSANAVRVENVLFDCGVPYKKLKDVLYQVDTLCITHTHKDHINSATLGRIHKDFPRVEIFGNYDVVQKFGDFIKPIATAAFTSGGVLFVPGYGTHDVPVTFYAFEVRGARCLYATDTNTLPDDLGKFDYMFLESNYDEKKLFPVLYQNHKGWNPAEGNLRHYSTKQCKLFFYSHRRTRESQLIELHKSSRFY